MGLHAMLKLVICEFQSFKFDSLLDLDPKCDIFCQEKVFTFNMCDNFLFYRKYVTAFWNQHSESVPILTASQCNETSINR